MADCSVLDCDAPAVYWAVMEWCSLLCCGGHAVCVGCGARLRRSTGLIRLHTLETA